MISTFTVKVKSGKRTPVEVWVETHYNEKQLVFTNGRKLTDTEIAAWIADKLSKELKFVENMEAAD